MNVDGIHFATVENVASAIEKAEVYGDLKIEGMCYV